MSRQDTSRRLTVHLFLSTVFKYWRFISLCVGIATLATMLYMLRSPDIYRSSITVAVNPERLQSVSLIRKEQYVTNASLKEMINSEMAVLTSSRVLEEAWRSFRPDEVESMGEERLRRRASQLAHSVTSAPVRNALLSSVSFQNADPELCAGLLNGLIAARMKLMLEDRQEMDNANVSELLATTSAVIDSLDQVITQMQVDEGLFSTEQQLAAVLNVRTSNALQIQELRQDVLRLGYQVTQLQTGLDSDLPIEDIPVSQTNSVLNDLRSDCRTQLRVLDNLSLDFVDGARELQTARLELERLRGQYRAEVEQALAILTAELEVGQAELEERLMQQEVYDRQLRRFPALRGVLDRLNSERDKQQSVLNILRDQRNEAQIAFLQLSSSRYLELVSPADVPLRPVKPRRVLSTISAFILSLLVSVVLCFLLENAANVIESPDELADLLDVEVVASLRRIGSK